jgi:hypothetical protein
MVVASSVNGYLEPEGRFWAKEKAAEAAFFSIKL